MILVENCEILHRKEDIDPGCLGTGGTMCHCFCLHNFNSATNNLWSLGGLCAAQRGGAGMAGDPLVEERLLLLCVVITMYHSHTSLPVYLIFSSWHFKKDPNVW